MPSPSLLQVQTNQHFLDADYPVRLPHCGSGPGIQKGFTLAEALIAIGLAVVLLSVFTSVLASTAFLRRAQYNVLAANYIQEELDSLRTLPYGELLTRTNSRFLGVAMKRGPWRVLTTAGAPSGAKVFAMETAQTAVVEDTGLALLPGDYREAFTFSTSIKVLPASPAGWGAGIAFRYRDAENHYRLRISAGGTALDKVLHGTRTTIWSNSTANSTNTWYTLEVQITDATIIVSRNGTLLTTQTDTSFTTGDTGLILLNGGLAHYDNVTMTEGATTTWNFDADADESVPPDWQRMSVADLPSGTGTLTIANSNGDADAKVLTVSVGWNDAGQARSVSGSTIITK